MTNLDRLHQSLFPDSTLLNVPDFARLIRHGDTHSVIVRYSDLERLREHHRTSPLPPFSLYLILDGHIGEYPIPLTEFTAITPYGMFRVNATVSKDKLHPVKNDTATCTACTFGVVPCEKHIKE